jgi:hypothetical protein
VHLEGGSGHDGLTQAGVIGEAQAAQAVRLLEILPGKAGAREILTLARSGFEFRRRSQE